MAIGTGSLTYQFSTPGSTWRKLVIIDQIFLQTPIDTPYFELTGNTTATSRIHMWQTVAIAARASNAQLEGAGYTYGSLITPSRVQSATQIVRQTLEMSRSMQKESAYGADDPWKKQLEWKLKEHRNDLEFNLIRANGTIGDATNAAQTTGLLNCITTNASSVGNTTFTE